MHRDILQPVIVLIAWTLVMWAWMLIVRMPALKAANVDLGTLVGGRGADADRVLPPRAQWPAHNYNHLLEQPTLFYAICLTIVLAGAEHPVNTAIAWAYVGLRIVHSLVQVTVNRVLWRFALFVLSTLCLVALTLHAAMAAF